MKKIYAHMTRDDLEDAYAQCSRTNEEYSVSLTTAEARIVTLGESLHYCNGTADLAIQHRDAAEAENDRLSKLADVSIADGAALRRALEPFADAADDCIDEDEPGDSEAWEHSCAAGVTLDNFRAARQALSTDHPGAPMLADTVAYRAALEKLAWETVADKGGSEASACRLCGGVLDHVPDCILSTGRPGAGVMAVVTAAMLWRKHRAGQPTSTCETVLLEALAALENGHV